MVSGRRPHLMSKPLPIVSARSGPEREKVLDAIYAAGWAINGNTRARGAGSDFATYIYLETNSWFYYCSIDSFPQGYTLVNSPTHLIAYCRSLPQPPKSLIVKPLPAPPQVPF